MGVGGLIGEERATGSFRKSLSWKIFHRLLK